MSKPPLVKVNRYDFSEHALETIRTNALAGGNWPLVYVLSDDGKKQAYVGETTDTLTRLKTHLKHGDKQKLSTVHLISSERFNKSATLDIESNLIQYMGADGKYRLLNGNLGLVDHNYYQKDEMYGRIFQDAWDSLRRQGVVSQSIEAINNTDVFKYSPYKSLSYEQRQGLLGIMHGLLDPEVKNLVIEGGAGTGKSVLAIFLFKLLHSSDEQLDLREFSEDEAELRELLLRLRQKYPSPKMALVVPMASFRHTLKKSFANVAGLKASMVVGPSDLASTAYDIVLVDESHRLRKRANLGAYFGRFDAVCNQLGLDKTACSEVDWVLQQADKSVFFYDENQSIKPSDANTADFVALKQAQTTQVQQLASQFRVRGGNTYVQFIDQLLNRQLPAGDTFQSKRYEFALFDSLDDMVNVIAEKNRLSGLSRLIAGYSWPWNSRKDPSLHDIRIESVELRWNSTSKDWISQPGAEHEVGCIHTTQGYDLNYAGIIFGNEIRYDRDRDEIVIDENHYFDRNGKQGIRDPHELKQYILNIYKTILLRSIKGTFVYACDDALREYLKTHIPMHATQPLISVAPVEPIKPYVNAVPLYDLQAAAGAFSDAQSVEQKDWARLPPGTKEDEDLFACRVVGESMNRVIPNGATCLFRKDTGGSRQGKIVLVEWADRIDQDNGSHYTVKEYESTKVATEEGWTHQLIRLKPRSHDTEFEPLELTEDEAFSFRVVGILERVLD